MYVHIVYGTETSGDESEARCSVEAFTKVEQVWNKSDHAIHRYGIDKNRNERPPLLVFIYVYDTLSLLQQRYTGLPLGVC